MNRSSLPTHHLIHHQRGFTLFEIILALLILAIAIVPMMNAFAPALLATGQGEEQSVLTGKARGTMNRLLDLDFLNLNTHQGNPADLVALLRETVDTDEKAAAEAAKENLDYNGITYVPVIAVTDFSSGAGGLLELTVTLKNVTLQTLKANR